MPDNTPTTPEAFAARVKRVGPCLEYTGGRVPRGYGTVSYMGRNWPASRLAWFLAYGPIPPGMYVCHTCDNPPCVELLHLFLGTNADNQRDAVVKGRNFAPRGALNGQARLTESQVREIRALAASGVAHRELGQRFGVATKTITKVVSRISWASLV